MLNKHKVKRTIRRKTYDAEKLAELSGIRESTISDICRGSRTVMNFAHIAKIADVLDIYDVRDLIELRKDHN